MPDIFDRISPEEGLLESLRGLGPVLVSTDAGRSQNLEYARRAAAMLAAEINTGLVLHDRSAETWGDTPHAERISGAEAARELGAEHLATQITEAFELGADPVHAYRSSVPTFDGFLKALNDTGAQVIVAPTSLDHPRLFDRLQIPRGDLIARLAEVNGPRPILVAEPDGRIHLPRDPAFVRWWVLARQAQSRRRNSSDAHAPHGRRTRFRPTSHKVTFVNSADLVGERNTQCPYLVCYR